MLVLKTLVLEETFTGEFTGSVNITQLRRWLVATQRPVLYNAMPLWNVGDLINSHEWDDSFTRRINSLCEKPEMMKEPLVYVPSDDGGVFIIDGWHRLYILYQLHRANKSKVVPFHAYSVSIEECKKFPPYGAPLC